MKKIIPVLALFITACTGDIKKSAPENQDLSFDVYKERFVERLWELYPGWASGIGYHKYDSVLIVPSAAQREKELAFIKANTDSLKHFSLPSLSDNNKTDYHLLDDYFKGAQWGITDLKSYEWDPSNYNVCGTFAEMLNNNYDSLDVRLGNVYLKMVNIPAYYSEAKKKP